MKRVHIVGAGGVAGVGLTRCLRDHYIVQGHDQSVWAERMAECPLEGADGVENLHYCDLIIPVPDKAVLKYSDHDLTFLPPRSQVELCQDKARTAVAIKELAPKTFWVRPTVGAGGQGAEMCSEYLPGRNFSCELLYRRGELLAEFVKERLSYRVNSVDPNVNGIGSSAVSRCFRSQRLSEIAKEAVKRVANADGSTLHGVYGIDLREDANGQPKVTEINAGRFLTASYVYFYQTGFNLALAMVRAFFNEPLELGEYPEGIGVIRQTDSLPFCGRF